MVLSLSPQMIKQGLLRGGALEIVRRIKQASGEPLFVGGCVRDFVLGASCKDVDIEVYGLGIDQILLAFEGLKLDIVGKNFGILKVFIGSEDFDVSVPRRENKLGVGHKNFSVEVDPNMTVKEAASRRDFTINSIAATSEGQIVDHYGALRDIQDRVLRATSDQFSEDPLRVLRGMQFAGRFLMTMEPGTVSMCQSIAHEFNSLAKERIWEEFSKLLSKGLSVSHGIQVLKDTGWLRLFPELFAIHEVPQDPIWHPEGDVLIHTAHVSDAALDISRREGLDFEDHLELLFSALLHDVGKAVTTVKNDVGRWTAPAHAERGVPIAKSFLESIMAPKWLIAKVLPLVAEHMYHLSISQPNERLVRRLSERLHPASLTMWSHICEADHSGRPPLPKANPVSHFLDIGRRIEVANSKPKPILMGRHLIAEDMQPGPEFRKVLDWAYEVQLDSGWTTTDEALTWLKAQLGV